MRISWKAPGGAGVREAWQVLSLGLMGPPPPQASPEPLVTGAAGRVPGGGEPRTSWVGCVVLPEALLLPGDTIQAGSLRCPVPGWGEPTAVSVTVSCDRSTHPQHPCWPTQLPVAPLPAGGRGYICLLTTLERHKLSSPF